MCGRSFLFLGSPLPQSQFYGLSLLLPLRLFFSHKGWMNFLDLLWEGRAGSELWIVEWFCGSMGRSVD